MHVDPRDLSTCEALLRRGSKSFAAAARLLPPRVRAPTTVLYAFCRVADDAIDAGTGAPAAALEALRASLDRAYADAPADDPVERALAALVRDHALPRAPLDALLDGFAWDAARRPCETPDDLHAYAARVAAAVGVAMTWLMGVRDFHVLARACDLGIAMQLTNVARDVGEDARAGRLYLPHAWMREEGLEPDDFVARPAPGPALGRVVERVLAEADRLYWRADRGIAWLPRDCRPAVRAARLCYARIGAKLRDRGCDSVTVRAVVPAHEKAALLARACAAAWQTRAACDFPALPAARFLIA